MPAFRMLANPARVTALLGGLTIGLMLGTVADVQAQSRRQPLVVKVEPRSWLDAGRGGSSTTGTRHLTGATFTAAPAFAHVGGRYGEDTLPPRIGAGINPFANTFSTGSAR